ncbi:MAG TPA: hypothetical protein VIK18_11635 [Pirellulales bacterium]
MQLLIYWNIFADANSDQKCRKLIEKFESAIGMALKDATIERYWKDKALFKVHALSRLDIQSNKDGFFTVMTKAGQLFRTWIIKPPSEEWPWQFGATSQAASGRIPGIDSVFFEAEVANDPRASEIVHAPLASRAPIGPPDAGSTVEQ